VCGDRCFADALYEPARILFGYIPNYGKLASCLVHLERFQVRGPEMWVDGWGDHAAPRRSSPCHQACTRVLSTPQPPRSPAPRLPSTPPRSDSARVRPDAALFTTTST